MNAPDKRYLRSIRLLSECMQAFSAVSAKKIRAFGLTPAQFDILATLGNTPGMSCKALGEHTLMTKGTLTGVLDRMEQQGWLQRERHSSDRRMFHVCLSPAGQSLFEAIFPQVVADGQARFAEYREADFLALEGALTRLKRTLSRC